MSKNYLKPIIFCLIFSFGYFLVATAQSRKDSTNNVEIVLSKDTARNYFGVYEFNPDFKMKIFSETANRFFAQRMGDPQKFQIFPKQSNVFFLKVMPAQLEFIKSADGSYDTLILHQGGKDMKATRISYQPYELYDTIIRQDSAFYAAYNNRDLKTFMSYLSPNLEFYHDLTGLTDYKKNFEIFKEKFADTSLIMRRQLVAESTEVYPIKDFGAVETGTQQFYVAGKEKGDRLAAEPKFIHLWKNTNGKWQIVRVISYDH
jgi:ketosteroid isomerase-like protein